MCWQAAASLIANRDITLEWRHMGFSDQSTSTDLLVSVYQSTNFHYASGSVYKEHGVNGRKYYQEIKQI
jgi:hypothetical protein